jgi:hypothetical protein
MNHGGVFDAVIDGDITEAGICLFPLTMEGYSTEQLFARWGGV